MNKVTVGVLTTLIIILILSGLLAYVSHSPAPASPSTESAKSVDETQRKSPLIGNSLGPTPAVSYHRVMQVGRRRLRGSFFASHWQHFSRDSWLSVRGVASLLVVETHS